MALISDSRELLRRIDVFSDLQGADLERLAALLQEVSYRREEIILHKEDPGDSLFIIRQGRVKVVLYGDDGREVILSILRDGDFFGEMSLLDGEPRSAFVVAMEDSCAYILKRDAFLDTLMERPMIALKILGELSRRLRLADDKIGSLALLDVYGRIAGALLQLARTEGKVEGDKVIIDSRPTQQEIASMAGASRETVSRVLSDLAKSGLISMEGKRVIITRDLHELRDVHGERVSTT